MRNVFTNLCLIIICSIQMMNNTSAMASDTIVMPPDFDGLTHPALQCDKPLDKNIDIGSFLLNSPLCVGGEILDSAFWLANTGEPDEYPKRRLPKVLGWNYNYDTIHPNYRLPSPDTIMYPAHNAWSPNDPVCWGPDQHIMGSGTGRPYDLDCSNLIVSYTDSIIDLAKPNCDSNLSCYEVIRSWLVIDSCTGNSQTHKQLITVKDTSGPEILYPDTLVINLESHACMGRWEVSPAWLVDNCSNEIHYTVQVDDGVVLGNQQSGYVVINMPRGLQNGYIIAEDCCGNFSEKKIVLNVFDNTPPNIICESNITISIVGNAQPGNNFGVLFADACAIQTDSCQPVFLKIIRMEQLRGTNNGAETDQVENGFKCTAINGDDNPTLDGNQIYFDDRTMFCCTDVDQTMTVVLRAFDIDPGSGPVHPSKMKSGGILFNHFSDCIITVEVKDRTVPTVVAPPNIVISCSFPFNITKLSDPNDTTFGKVVNDLSNRGRVQTLDKVCYNYCVKNDKTGYPAYESGAPPSNPPVQNRACNYYTVLFDTAHADSTYKLAWGFDGYVLSACENEYNIFVKDLRICGQGKITRTIVTNVNGVTVTATQTIWVIACDLFYINRDDYCDTLDDIIWPGNCNGLVTTITHCGNNPNPEDPSVGKPLVDKKAKDQCNSINITYRDEVIGLEPDACFKINRLWTVTDNCQYDPIKDSTNGKWEYLQKITIHDNETPELKINIGNQSPSDSNGLADIKLTVDVSDNCVLSNEILVSYKIDEFNDGIGTHAGYDYRMGPLSINAYNQGQTPFFNDNPHAFYSRNTVDASGKYPLGIHKICWYGEDSCGNLAANCQLFEIKKVVSTINTDLIHQLIIMPNPGKGTIQIKSENKMDMIRLISGTGQTVQSFTIQNKQSIELDTLASGMYFVQAYHQGIPVASAKLVVVE
jgi:hypothetical protein